MSESPVQIAPYFRLLEKSLLKKNNQSDYERAHSHSSCYLATNKALLVIAVPLLAAKHGQRLFYYHLDCLKKA